MKIATLADLEALEAQGFEAVFPHRTPFDVIRASAARAPDAVALRELRPEGERVLTYAAFVERIHAAANLFRAMGVTGERAVALLKPHTAAAQTALWGAQLAGRACPINPMLRPEHIAELLAEADAALVIVMGVNAEQDIWSALVPGLRAAGVRLPILDCDADAPCPGSDGRFEDLLEAHAGPLGFDIPGDEHATAAFYHTGGTTGAPKLVRHTRLNEAHVARSCAILHDLRADDVVVNGFPLFHVAGAFVYGLSTLSAGGEILIPGRLGMRDPAFTGAIWQQVERRGVTILAAVPTLLAAFNGVDVDADISGLRALLTGGSPLPTELAEATERKTGKPVRNILGMTECAGAIAVEPLHGPRTPGSCGLRMPFSEVVALADYGDGDPDTSQRTAQGETGIIALRGPNVSPGYTDPTRGRDTFPGGGWLVSGDLGHIDAEGRVFVTGRKKDVIIRGGHNIDPQGIEDALLAHEAVQDAAAVGMPDAYAGELPVAFVTRRKGADLDEAALMAFLRARIDEPAALPKRIAAIEAMPLTPIGKVFKPALRRIAAEWALRAAAEQCGLSAEAVGIEVDDKLRASLTVPEGAEDRLRAALAGMPIEVSVSTRTEAAP
jgi:fatty-acyl-CoA synthase